MVGWEITGICTGHVKRTDNAREESGVKVTQSVLRVVM